MKDSFCQRLINRCLKRMPQLPQLEITWCMYLVIIILFQNSTYTTQNVHHEHNIFLYHYAINSRTDKQPNHSCHPPGNNNPARLNSCLTCKKRSKVARKVVPTVESVQLEPSIVAQFDLTIPEARVTRAKGGQKRSL